MNWLLLTILSVVTVSVANILQRVLMKDDKSNPYSYAIVFHFLLGLLNLCFALFYGSQFSLFSGNFLLLLLASFLWGMCSIFLFKALQLLQSSEVTILASLKVVFTIVAAVIFLQETFNGQKILGTIIILVATLLVVNLKNGFKFNKGIIYTLAMALFAGLALVVDSVNVQHYDVIAYNTMANFFSGLIILAFAPRTLLDWQQFIKPNFLAKMLPLSVFSTAQGIMYLTALTHAGNTAQVGTIRQAMVIVTALLAVIFLRERNNLSRKLLAAIMVTIGVILLR